MIKKIIIITFLLLPSFALAAFYGFSDGQTDYIYDGSNPPTSNFDMRGGFIDGQSAYLFDPTATITPDTPEAEATSTDRFILTAGTFLLRAGTFLLTQ